MSIAQFNALYDSASAAFDAADYASAIAAASKAQVLLSTSPNLSRSLGDGGSQSIQWNDGSAIERFIATCRRMQKAATAESSGMFRQSKVTYQRASD